MGDSIALAARGQAWRQRVTFILCVTLMAMNRAQGTGGKTAERFSEPQGGPAKSFLAFRYPIIIIAMIGKKAIRIRGESVGVRKETPDARRGGLSKTGGRTRGHG